MNARQLGGVCGYRARAERGGDKTPRLQTCMFTSVAEEPISRCDDFKNITQDMHFAVAADPVAVKSPPRHHGMGRRVTPDLNQRTVRILGGSSVRSQDNPFSVIGSRRSILYTLSACPKMLT